MSEATICLICSICGRSNRIAVRRTNTKGEKVLDVCHLCNHSIQKTVTRQNRRANQKNVPSRLVCAQWIEILQQSQGYCHYCKEHEGGDGLTLDHVIPLSKGGANSAENIVAACTRCNVGKQTSSAAQWLDKMEGMNNASK